MNSQMKRKIDKHTEKIGTSEKLDRQSNKMIDLQIVIQTDI